MFLLLVVIGISIYVWLSIVITVLLVPAQVFLLSYLLMDTHQFYLVTAPPDDAPVTISSYLSSAREIITRAATHLQHIQQRYKTIVDRHWCHVEFAEGDTVFLRVRFARYRFVQGLASTEKLAPRYYGPFQILERLSPVTYRLKLPAATRACDIFHVSLLRAAIEDDAPRDSSFPTDPELFPFLPAAILQVRLLHSRRHRQVQFLVQWDGRPIEEATWEPIDVFYHTPILADQARSLAATIASRDASASLDVPFSDGIS
ncbi:hypothetical protein O6H91_01G084400 [Diphasiastrum complanatum]|uniref:Uncharacterized protein n=1 Tax=Diphasiastrum complanatum TaxID=34168 RepID=A0ACC2ET94_DIPCM|nr:hypothetical protein O6H91_01G084400 [Diphasiastrum complanatum]